MPSSAERAKIYEGLRLATDNVPSTPATSPREQRAANNAVKGGLFSSEPTPQLRRPFMDNPVLRRIGKVLFIGAGVGVTAAGCATMIDNPGDSPHADGDFGQLSPDTSIIAAADIPPLSEEHTQKALDALHLMQEQDSNVNILDALVAGNLSQVLELPLEPGEIHAGDFAYYASLQTSDTGVTLAFQGIQVVADTDGTLALFAPPESQTNGESIDTNWSGRLLFNASGEPVGIATTSVPIPYAVTHGAPYQTAELINFTPLSDQTLDMPDGQSTREEAPIIIDDTFTTSITPTEGMTVTDMSLEVYPQTDKPYWPAFEGLVDVFDAVHTDINPQGVVPGQEYQVLSWGFAEIVIEEYETLVHHKQGIDSGREINYTGLAPLLDVFLNRPDGITDSQYDLLKQQTGAEIRDYLEGVYDWQQRQIDQYWIQNPDGTWTLRRR